MNVLMVGLKISTGFGGVESYCYNLASILSEHKYEVNAISTNLTNKMAANDHFRHIGLLPNKKNIKIFLYRLYNYLTGEVLLLDYYLKKLASKADVIIVGHFNLLSQVVKALKGSHKKIWLIVYGIDIWREWTEEEAESIESCDKIITISSFTKSIIESRLSDKNKIVVIPCFVDPTKFVPSRTHISETPRVLLTVGRLASCEGYKGHDLLIKSISMIEKEINASVEYRIVGDGDDVPRLRNIANIFGVSEKVKFLGRLHGLSFVEEYRKCHLFAMPSYISIKDDGTWTGEGFGIVYIEAAACGKPVLACDEGGQTDCIINGVTGVLVKPNVESVSQGVISILKDFEVGVKMGEAGRKFVTNNFSRDVFKENWIRFISELEN